MNSKQDSITIYPRPGWNGSGDTFVVYIRLKMHESIKQLNLKELDLVSMSLKVDNLSELCHLLTEMGNGRLRVYANKEVETSKDFKGETIQKLKITNIESTNE